MTQCDSGKKDTLQTFLFQEKRKAHNNLYKHIATN